MSQNLPKVPTIDLTFPHHWQAEILPARPLILPPRHFVYPRDAEEIERGALEVLIHPKLRGHAVGGVDVLKGHGFSRAADAPGAEPALAAEGMHGAEDAFPPGLKPRLPTCSSDVADEADPTSQPQLFLATCALGFRVPTVPTGLWSCPNPEEICAVSGGYAYIINAADPARFTMIAFRPVLEVCALPAQRLLLFVGHHAMLAWAATGQAWQSEKLSDEGVTITAIEAGKLHGQGWSMITDKETPFTLDLNTGRRTECHVSEAHTRKELSS